MQNKPVTVHAETTPNPQSMKFIVSRNISHENWETTDIKTAQRSPIAQKLLGFPWALKIFIGTNFITISKEDWVEWSVLTPALTQIIQEHINDDLVVLYDKQKNEKNLKDSSDEEEDPSSPNFKTIQKIKHILKTEVQPAVAMDGGFISFSHYKNGTVFLKMQGACSGCPSASVTLKQGIQNLLQNRIPEVKEVVSVS